jgi:hypothetical protein
MNKCIGLLSLLLLAGCQATNPLRLNADPVSPWWELGFTSPSHMQAYVEYSSVLDVNGMIYHNTGVANLITRSVMLDKEVARGWNNTGFGSTAVEGAGLPLLVYVRWQSIVETQTYRAWIKIPEEARQILKNAPGSICVKAPKVRALFSSSLFIGVAPKGKVKVWVLDECFQTVEVTTAQGEIEPLGPFLGRGGGRYIYDLSESSKRYIERWGIPYGSW